MSETMQRMPDDACCLGCRYQLRGLTSCVCPECGRAFDPGDASTYMLQRSGGYWRRWARPPGAWHAGILPVATLCMLLGLSGPYYMSLWGGFRMFCLLEALLIFLTVTAVVDYIVRAFAYAQDRDRARLDRGSSSSVRSKSWWVLPVCLCVLLSARVTDWPMTVRFHASRRAMERAATGYLDGTLNAGDPGWIGLYRFRSVYEDDVGVGFMKGGPYWEYAGFYFSPDDSPPSGGDILRWRRIAPNWFVFEWDF